MILGDSLIAVHNGKKFSTKDQDHDTYSGGHCAVNNHGAWWYQTCHTSNLNGKYYYSSQNTHVDGTTWDAFKQRHSLKATEMKFRASV